jgi:hypothetical protein
MSAASYTRGGPEVLGSSTLLDAICRTPGTPKEVEREIATRLVSGELELRGTFRGHGREIGCEVLNHAR